MDVHHAGQNQTERDRHKLSGCFIACVNLSERASVTEKKKQAGVYVGTCGAGGSVAAASQLNEDEDEWGGGFRGQADGRGAGTKASEGVSAADCCC